MVKKQEKPAKGKKKNKRRENSDTPIGRVLAFVKKQGSSREELAHKIDISFSAVNMWIISGAPLRKVNALAMQAVYGVSSSWIMKGKGPEEVEKFAVDPKSVEFGQKYDSLDTSLKQVVKIHMKGLSCFKWTKLGRPEDSRNKPKDYKG